MSISLEDLKLVEKEICARECACLFVSMSLYWLAVSMVTVDQYQVTVKIIVDFSGGAEIYDKIRMELSGLEIGILINNVGVSYKHPDCFLNVPDDS